MTELKQHLIVIAFTLPRPLALFSLMPFFGKGLFHGLVRNSIVVCIALVLYPVTAAAMPPISGALMFMGVLVKEVFLGILMGFVIGLFFRMAEGVGYVIDNQRGTTMASVFDPSSGEQTSPLGSMLLQTIIVLFFTGGGFLVLLSGLFQSYDVWPIFSLTPRLQGDFVTFFLGLVDHLMMLILVLAAPVLIAIFVAEFGLGLINRFAPQLNVFFLSMPIKSAIATLMLILYMGGLLTFFDQTLSQAVVMLPKLEEVLGE